MFFWFIVLAVTIAVVFFKSPPKGQAMRIRGPEGTRYVANGIELILPWRDRVDYFSLSPRELGRQECSPHAALDGQLVAVTVQLRVRPGTAPSSLSAYAPLELDASGQRLQHRLGELVDRAVAQALGQASGASHLKDTAWFEKRLADCLRTGLHAIGVEPERLRVLKMQAVGEVPDSRQARRTEPQPQVPLPAPRPKTAPVREAFVAPEAPLPAFLQERETPLEAVRVYEPEEVPEPAGVVALGETTVMAKPELMGETAVASDLAAIAGTAAIIESAKLQPSAPPLFARADDVVARLRAESDAALRSLLD